MKRKMEAMLLTKISLPGQPLPVWTGLDSLWTDPGFLDSQWIGMYSHSTSLDGTRLGPFLKMGTVLV